MTHRVTRDRMLSRQSQNGEARSNEWMSKLITIETEQRDKELEDGIWN